MTFPVTVTKGKEEAEVLHSADLKGWLEADWKIKGEKKPEMQEDKPKRRANRPKSEPK